MNQVKLRSKPHVKREIRCTQLTTNYLYPSSIARVSVVLFAADKVAQMALQRFASGRVITLTIARLEGLVEPEHLIRFLCFAAEKFSQFWTYELGKILCCLSFLLDNQDLMHLAVFVEVKYCYYCWTDSRDFEPEVDLVN